MSAFEAVDEEAEFVSGEQAAEFARQQAKRDLVFGPDRITYVGYVPDFHDFCRCEWAKEGDGWYLAVTLLPLADRLPDEQIPDETIVGLAREGNRIAAIRLFRARHGVGLAEAATGIERMLEAESL